MNNCNNAISGKIEKKKLVIQETLKGCGLFSDELQLQIDMAAVLFVKLEDITSAMGDGYCPITADGRINPLEKLLLSYVTKCQAALKSLCLNRDGKEVKTDGVGADDGLLKLMQAVTPIV